MAKKEQTLLNEIYRPDTLEGYLCSDELRSKIDEWIKKQDIPNIGLFGQQGSGKTTLAKILVNKKNIDCDCLILNATEERGMDVLKERVGKFASTSTFKKLKIVILDEATHILQASQVLLLNMIEEYSLKTRFILTGNYPERLIPALRSRLQEFPLSPPTKPVLAEHVVKILVKENIQYTLPDVKFLVNNCYPDIRKTINSIQKYTVNGKLLIDKNETKKDEYIDLILVELKKPSYKSFNTIRQTIVDNASANFEDVYKHLYTHVSEYAAGREGTIIVILEEYLFHSNFRIDQEICICAAISKILEVLSTKQLIK